MSDDFRGAGNGGLGAVPPSGVQGQSPWWGVPPELKLKTFHVFGV